MDEPTPIARIPLTHAERILMNEAGNGELGAYLLILYRRAPGIDLFKLVAIARACKYADQIADISIGSMNKELITEMMTPLNPPKGA